MEKIKYKIGNIGGDPIKESKFIVTKDENKFIMYSANLIDKDRPLHSTIAEENQIDRKSVLGGGKFKLEDDLIFYGWSSGFGPVPNKVAYNLGKTLVDHLGQEYFSRRGIKFNKIKTKMDPCSLSKKHEEKWRELGFDDRKK